MHFGETSLTPLFQDDTSGTFRLVIFYVSYAMFLLQYVLSFFVDHVEKAGKTKTQDEHSLLLGEQNDDIVDAVSWIIIAVMVNTT